MKLALVNGNEVEATKESKGLCRVCGSELIARCGEERVNHWSHLGRRNCDPWWENETEWHRSWKNHFPQEWQEVIHSDEISGEKHIADIKTSDGWVLEFQHSPIKPEERRTRNSFYPKLVWVIDGTRRQRDKPKFYQILEEYRIKSEDARIKRIIGPDDSALIKEWHESSALVFFDFQDVDFLKQPILWFLFPKTSANEASLFPFSRDAFIHLHKNNKFDELVGKIISPYLTKLINEEKMKAEMEMVRQWGRKQRANLFLSGRRPRW